MKLSQGLALPRGRVKAAMHAPPLAPPVLTKWLHAPRLHHDDHRACTLVIYPMLLPAWMTVSWQETSFKVCILEGDCAVSQCDAVALRPRHVVRILRRPCVPPCEMT